MSLILDALRRENASIRADRTAAQRTANAQSVLATLGYQPVRRHGFEAVGRWLLGIAGVALLGGGVWFAYVWFEIRSAARPEAVPAPQVARQAPADTGRPAPVTAAAPTPGAPAVSPGELREAMPVTPQQVTPRPAATPPGEPAAVVQQPPAEPSPPGTAAAAPLDRQPVAVEARPAPAVKTDRVKEPSGAEPVPPASGPSGAAITSSYEPDRFKLALYYHRAGDFENALVNYRAVLERNELNAEVRNNLGLLYQDKNLLDESVRELQRAISIDPTYAKAHNNLGVTFLRQGKLDAAMAEFRLALSIDPGSADPMTNLALALKTAGRSDEARDTLKRALEIDQTSAPSHYNLALLYDEGGDAVRAVEHFQIFLKVSKPEHAHLAASVRARIEALTARVKQ